MSIIIKSPEEVAIMRESGVILARILNALCASVRPGISTTDIDNLARRLCDEAQVKPTFLGYHGFPATVCTSVNDQVVHCIPHTEKILQEGDIIKLDFGVTHRGMITDACRSVAVGTISTAAQQLMDVTKKALYAGIDQAIVGKRIGDISHAIESTVRPYGYSPVRETVGHGVGHQLHEDPEIPNWGRPNSGPALTPGMTIAIEPIINVGTHRLITERDGWTTRTADGALSAHFEHTVHITPEGPEILTPWE